MTVLELDDRSPCQRCLRVAFSDTLALVRRPDGDEWWCPNCLADLPGEGSEW